MSGVDRAGGSSRDHVPVAVVIVSWNSAAYLRECLASLRALERSPAEIVVVDNRSSDGSAELVRREFPECLLLESAGNLGFCRANNLGIGRTSSPFVLVLNPDTRLEPRFLEELLPAFADPRVGIATGKLLRFDGRTLDTAGQRLARSRKPLDRGYGRLDRGQLDRDEPVFGACAAAALYRRAMLDSIADPDGEVFDEAFFAFYEDLDVAWRARRRGWTAAYRHRAVGYHARGATAVRGPQRGRRARRPALLDRPPAVRFHIVKNRYLTILRNDTVAGYLANLPFILARDLATVLLLLVTSPGVLRRLWSERGLFRRALARRRLDAAAPRHHVPGGESVPPQAAPGSEDRRRGGAPPDS